MHQPERPDHRSMDLPDALVRGTIDVHVHAGPHLRSSPRRVDPFQAAIQARDAGMRAIVYMDVLFESAGTAWMVGRMIEGIDVFGGIILNSAFGGMNPRAVRTALAYGDGARFVSFGAHSTHHLASREGRYVNGQVVLLKDLYPKFAEQELSRAIQIPIDGQPTTDLDEILSLVAEHPTTYLNTGHVSADEALALVRLARRYGIANVLVAHVPRAEMTLDQQREAIDQGAFLEATLADQVYPGGIPRTHYYTETEYRPEVVVGRVKHNGGFTAFADTVRTLGTDRFVLGTDYGIRAGPPPVEGMRMLVGALLDLDFTPEEIERLTATNAARLLSLGDPPAA